MPSVPAAARRLLHGAEVDFATVRTELEIAEEFPAAVTAASQRIAAEPPDTSGYDDATHIEFVTVDPAGSRDLDQAFAIERNGDGYRLWYAIADVGAFVAGDEALNTETWARGETLYCPDRSIPLHPRVLSEGAASLLPGQERPAALWRIDFDANGEAIHGSVQVRRSRVRSRVQYDYESLAADLEAGTAPSSATLLPELGRLRLAVARRRGAIDLPIPEQRVVPSVPGDPGSPWTVEFRQQSDIERWNAQLSLATGMAAATIMLDAGVGILRTLPAPDQGTLDHVRRAAKALSVPWPDGASPGEVISTVDASTPRGAAFADLAASLLRGAAYRAFNGTAPPSAEQIHAGIASTYAHVTAPLRRLVDRYGTEVCLAVCAGQPIAKWALDGLEALPETMAASNHRAHAVERACVDLAEAWLLRPRVGDTFTAAVVELGRDGGNIVLDDPAVRARCRGKDLPLGEQIEARLVEADVSKRTVHFASPP